MKNRSLTVFLAMLIVLALLAPVALAQGWAGAAAAARREPSISVRDQKIDGGTVTVARVVSNGPGWVVIHRNDGAAIGRAQVGGGDNERVVVHIDAGNASPVLRASLHKDEGGPGPVVRVNGQPVSETFRVSQDNKPGPGPCQKDCGTPRPRHTPRPTAQATATRKPCQQPCATRTPRPTVQATNTPFPTPTVGSGTATPTTTPFPTATNTPFPTPTVGSGTATPTNTPLPTATNTPLPTATNTPLPTASPTVGVATATPTWTPSPTRTPTAPAGGATATPTWTPSPTVLPSSTASPTVGAATATVTPFPTGSGLVTPTSVVQPTPGVLPVTGGEGSPWSLILLIVGGMALVNGLGLMLIRQVGGR